MGSKVRRGWKSIAIVCVMLSSLGGDCVEDLVPQAPTYSPEIGGVEVHCNDFMGAPVLTVFDPALDDIGRALPPTFQSPPRIVLNSRLLSRLPDDVQLFWYGHECAHHVLGHLAFPNLMNESAADCWSVQTLKQQGLADRSGIVQTASYLLASPGTPWGHLPGPARANLLVSCWDSAPSAASASSDLFWIRYEEDASWN